MIPGALCDYGSSLCITVGVRCSAKCVTQEMLIVMLRLLYFYREESLFHFPTKFILKVWFHHHPQSHNPLLKEDNLIWALQFTEKVTTSQRTRGLVIWLAWWQGCEHSPVLFHKLSLYHTASFTVSQSWRNKTSLKHFRCQWNKKVQNCCQYIAVKAILLFLPPLP